jgi:hypothetical protein
LGLSPLATCYETGCCGSWPGLISLHTGSLELSGLFDTAQNVEEMNKKGIETKLNALLILTSPDTQKEQSASFNGEAL